MRKKIGFYCCSNGYGHFRRVIEIANLLSEKHSVEIFCSTDQLNKFTPLQNVTYNLVDIENINWQKALNGNKEQVIDSYFDWVQEYGQTTEKFDIVVSDNMPGILGYRNDAIILGSFLWKDVFMSKFGDNRLTTFDNKLIDKYQPIIVTNKYAETQSVKQYTNKVQYGFGCKDRRKIFSSIKNNLVNKSSLKYLDSYKDFIQGLSNSIEFTDDFSSIDNTIMFARPGVGTITHCVENYIPLIALYDENDSEEILELAQIVEDLKLGFKQNVNQPFNEFKYKIWSSNSNILYGPKLEINAYSKIAKYIENYEY